MKAAATALADIPKDYNKLRTAFAALGGSLKHVRKDQPVGGTWVATLGGKMFSEPSTQSGRYPALDVCYRLRKGHTYNTWNDCTSDIDPAGVAKLFARLV